MSSQHVKKSRFFLHIGNTCKRFQQNFTYFKCEIACRLPDVDIKDIQKKLYGMVRSNKLSTIGSRGNRRYNLIE